MYEELFDTRKLPEQTKIILSQDEIEHAKEIISKDFNIDTLSQYNYNSYKEQTDTFQRSNLHFKSYGVETSYKSLNLTFIHPFFENFMAVRVEGRKQMEDLSVEETRELLLESLLVERISRQTAFNKTINIGDAVYKISFDYLYQSYTVFVICSRETKKVILDYFFSAISVWK